MASVPADRVDPSFIGVADVSAPHPHPRRVLYEHTPFLIIVALYVVAGTFILRAVGGSSPLSFARIYRWPVALTGLYLAATFLLAIGRDVFLARRRPGSLATWRRLFSRWLGADRALAVLIVLIALPALLGVMMGFRVSLTTIHPFSWDVELMRADLWLHGGHHPWELLQPLLGHPIVTDWLDTIYVYGWFIALWFVVIWQTVHGREPLRLQFLLSFSIGWILLGTIAAIAFSSAGPVYFARVTALPDPYLPLTAYLNGVDAERPLFALANQQRLWNEYREWGGITAMPSMHMALTTIVALAAIRAHRWLAVIAVPLGVAILLGSIHLGWHYAVDSYAGVLGAIAIWFVCGRVARWWIARRAILGSGTHVV